MKNKNNIIKIRISLFDRLAVFFVTVSIVFIMTLIMASIKNYRIHQETFVMDVMEGLSVNQEIQLVEYISEKEQIIKGLTKFPEIYEMDRETYTSFIRNNGRRFGFSEMFIVDNEGIAFYPSEGVERNQSDEEFFKNISENDFYVTTPFYSLYGPITTLCKAIYDPFGRRVGTLCGKVTIDSIQKIVENNQTILGGQCFLITREGQYISCSEKKDLYASNSIFSRSSCELKLVRKAIFEEKDMKGTIIIDGTQYYAYIKYISEYGWVAIVCVPVSNVSNSYQYITYLQYLLIIMILMLCFVIVHILKEWKRSDTQMYLDSLCKCGSRAACLKAMEDIEKENEDYVILFADLNNFKYVNDNYGHETGDKILIIFRNVLTEVFGKLSFIGRMGGDEFVVFTKNQTIDFIEEKWKLVEEKLKEESEMLSFEYKIEAAHGCVIRRKDSTKTMYEMVQTADNKMYINKGNRSR